MRRKKKKVLSFLMALSVFMTGSGIGGTSAAIAPDDNAAPEQYTVTLPIYEACDYRYETSHNKESSNANQEIVLQYEAGAQVAFDVVPGEGWIVDKMQLFGNKSEIPLMITNQTIRFSMPEEDVIFRAQFHHAEETGTGNPDSVEIPDSLGETVSNDSDFNASGSGEEESFDENETEDMWENETEDFPGETREEETEDLWTEESEDLSGETEALPTEAPEEMEEPSTDDPEETEEPWADGSEETENATDDTWTEETESEESETLSDEDESETNSDETEKDPKHWTLRKLDTPWEETVTEEESDAFSEWETEEGAFDEESEMECESESEMEIPEGCYQVILPQSTEYEISFCEETKWYQPGEEVSFQLEATSELKALEIAAYSIKDTTTLELERSLEKEQLPLSFEEEEVFHFEMPASDVLLLVNTDDAVKVLADEEDNDPVPDRFKLVVNGVCSAPSVLNNGHAASTHKTVVFFESDGTKIAREAYCIQPRLNSPGSGTVYDKDTTEYLDGTAGMQSERRMSKGMFYLYGGPAWGRTIEMSDGSSVNLKSVMDQAGCSSNSNYYTITHYVLSYFYLNGTDWNYNSNYTNVLNAAGVGLVKTLASYIIKMPNPASYLTVPELQATYRKASGKSVTPSTVYKSFEENTATVTLPNGITLVNETTGKSFTGKATLNGGDRFHLEADSSVAAGTVQLTLTCKYPVDYQALKLGLKGYQDIGFSYYSGEKQLVLSVILPDVPKNGTAYVQKLDALSKSTKLLNGNYSLAGAVYTVYKDRGCTEKVTALTTDENGRTNQAEMEVGTYYVKETKASKGYQLDEKLYTLKIISGETVTFTSYEEPIRKKLSVQKYDAETGKPSARSGSFEGAEYTVYLDEACTKKAALLTTDKKGYAESELLPLAAYYIKETKAPTGYELDTVVHRIAMVSGGETSVYPVTSRENPVKKIIEIQKYDKETGKPAPNNSAVKFSGAQYTIYEDKNCSKQVEVLTLNAAGYAKSAKLLPGTYYIRETKAPTGYKLDTLVHEVTVADDGQKSYRIQSYDPVIQGSLMLMKFLDDRYDESILQEWIDRGELSGIRFTLTHEDPSVPEKEIITDQYGYAATEARELVYGTWTLREDPSTTPEGYAGLKEAKVRIAKDGVQVKYIVTNSVQNAMIEIVKKDRQTGNAIPKSGAKFQILDSIGTPVVMQDNLDFGKMTDTFTTNEEGKIYLTKPLKQGTYTLKEVEAPENYLVADPLTFTVNGAHSYKEPLIIECFDEMQKGRIIIRKKDAKTQQPLGEGVQFEIRAAEDITDPMGTVLTMAVGENTVELKKGTQVAVVSANADGIAKSPELYLGKYEIREITAGEFYAVSNQIYKTELTYDRAEVSVEAELYIENEKTTLILQKEDSESTEGTPLPLSGIRFRIFTASELEETGGEIGQIPEEVLAALGTEYTTDENGQIEFTDLKHSTIYYLYESETLPGYNLEQKLYKVFVDADGRINGQARYTMKISNQANQIEITKWDITGDCELPGAELTLRNAEGNVIEQWISEETPHRIKGLAAGTYTLTEDRAPLGYAVAEAITFTLTDSLEVQQVVMNDEQIQVAISKKDITGQEELPGAALEVRAADGTLIDAWISDKEPHLLKLAAGSYTLTEVAAPEKYAKAETVSFEVRDDAALQKVEMRDAPIRVQISKQDITTEKELPGARLTVRDAEGTVIADWTSTEEPYFLNLAVGTYTLTEVVAPSGYCKAETITFEVTDTAEIQKVVMYDKPAPEQETETETESESETESETETEAGTETEETESETLKETETETEKQSEAEPKKPTTPGIVKTGDPTDFFPPFFGLISGLVLFAGTLAGGKQKKKRQSQK